MVFKIFVIYSKNARPFHIRIVFVFECPVTSCQFYTVVSAKFVIHVVPFLSCKWTESHKDVCEYTNTICLINVSVQEFCEELELYMICIEGYN